MIAMMMMVMMVMMLLLLVVVVGIEVDSCGFKTAIYQALIDGMW